MIFRPNAFPFSFQGGNVQAWPTPEMFINRTNTNPPPVQNKAVIGGEDGGDVIGGEGGELMGGE